MLKIVCVCASHQATSCHRRSTGLCGGRRCFGGPSDSLWWPWSAHLHPLTAVLRCANAVGCALTLGASCRCCRSVLRACSLCVRSLCVWLWLQGALIARRVFRAVTPPPGSATRSLAESAWSAAGFGAGLGAGLAGGMRQPQPGMPMWTPAQQQAMGLVGGPAVMAGMPQMSTVVPAPVAAPVPPVASPTLPEAPATAANPEKQ